jgi:hypothetical protein
MSLAIYVRVSTQRQAQAQAQTIEQQTRAVASLHSEPGVGADLGYGYRVDPDHPRDPAGVWLEPAEAAVIQDLFARYDEPSASLFALALGTVN